MSHDDATNRAIMHHLRWCERNGFIPDKPSASRNGDIVSLSNINGPMARYRVKPDGSVKRLDD